MISESSVKAEENNCYAMNTEVSQKAKWTAIGKYSVTSELFIDLIFNNACNCNCPFCIAKTKSFAEENFDKWKISLKSAFKIFDIKHVIILGGEATIDPCFWEKVGFLSELSAKVQNIILTTNGIRLRNCDFLNGIAKSCITSVNISYMNHDKAVNDQIFGADTLTKSDIEQIYRVLKANGKTLRINANVYRGNLDTVLGMNQFTDYFSGCCDYIKFSPLMDTEMFHTIDSVLDYSKNSSLSESEVRQLYDDYSSQFTVIMKSPNILGFVDYSQLSAKGQGVILKYAQVEDKYDRNTVIPTLKLYPNGNLSNEWDYKKDILKDF